MTTNKKVRFEDLFPIIKDTVERGNQFTFCAFGSSMLPYIRDGKDLVTLGPIESGIKKDDIIFYRRTNGQFVLHRIVKVHPNGNCDLCGDNQFRIEKDLPSNQIIAKLVLIQRNGKKILPLSFSSHVWCFFLPLRRFFLHVKSAILFRFRKLIKK